MGCANDGRPVCHPPKLCHLRSASGIVGNPSEQSLINPLLSIPFTFGLVYLPVTILINTNYLALGTPVTDSQ